MEKKAKNYSYFRQIPQCPEVEESMIAESIGLYTHLHTT